jgi:hypothetical protein
MCLSKRLTIIVPWFDEASTNASLRPTLRIEISLAGGDAVTLQHEAQQYAHGADASCEPNHRT